MLKQPLEIFTKGMAHHRNLHLTDTFIWNTKPGDVLNNLGDLSHAVMNLLMLGYRDLFSLRD